MALLALSQDRNWRTVGLAQARAPYGRGLGWAFLTASLVPVLLRDGLSFAALLWPMLIAASAIGVAMILAYRPALLRPLARIACVNEGTAAPRNGA